MSNAGASIEAVLTLNSSGFTEPLKQSTTALNQFANATSKLNNANSSKAIRGLNDALSQLESTLQTLDGINKSNLNTFSRLSTAINNMAKGLRILQSDAINVDQAVNTMNNIFKAFQGALSSVEVKVKGVSSSVKELTNSERAETQSLNQVATATRQYDQALTVTLPKQREMIINAVGVANAERQETVAHEQVAMAEEKQAISTDRATNSMNKQTAASNRLGKAMSSLRMIGTMVASMMVYNFAHNLIQATRETVNAKSEMNGYFQMLGYTSSEIDHFNGKLDQMIQKFPRINKYALGETISSIGVEFELTTKEMEKAMPVVSMITSEYLRAGRNVNEASLAVKDILQGEFQRLSRETGVKGDQLKEAGWSGDKTDVMGLLEALDKVGKSRNWDVFVAKANSLNDAVMILQNRFGEWSADMVERVQPTILSVFNDIMVVATSFGKVINGVLDWLSGDGIGQNIVKWTGLGIAIANVTTGLIAYRTGANLTQIAQMGLTKSIGASVLGLEAEAVAEHGLRNSIVMTISGLEAETLAEELNISTRRARWVAIMSTVTGLEAETVAELGLTKSLFASLFALDSATLKEEGFLVALGSATTGIEAQEFALMSYRTQLALTVGSIGLVAGALVVLTGYFAVNIAKVNDSIDNYNKFRNTIDKGQDIIDEYKGTVDSLTEKKQELSDKLETLDKNSYKYALTQDKLKTVTDDLTVANQNYTDSVNAVAWANHKQDLYDTSKQETALNTQKEINKALIDSGVSVKTANEMASPIWQDTIDGWNQQYETLQGVNEQYKKNANTVTHYLDEMQKKKIDPKEVEVLIKPLIKSGNKIADAKEQLGQATSLTEYVDKWLWLQYREIEHSINEFNLNWEIDDPDTAFEGLFKGFGIGLEKLKLPFPEFTSWITNQIKGWINFDGLNLETLPTTAIGTSISNWLESEFKKNIEDKTLMEILGLDENKDYIGDFVNWISSQFSSYDWIGAMATALTGVDVLGAIFNAILPAPASAEDGSDHPSFMEDVSNIIGFDVESWCNSFMSDPLGTLGITPPNLDLGEMVKSFFSSNSISITDLLSKLFSVDVSGIYQWVNDNIITPLVDGIKVGVLNTPVLGSVANLLGFDDDAESEASEKGQSVGSGFTTGVQTGIDPLDDVINSALSGLNLDGITSQFNTNAQSITTTASSTATNVSTSFSNMKNNQKTSLDSMALKNKTAFDDMKTKTSGTLLNMRDTTSQITSHVGKSFGTMKDNILSASNKLKTGSSNDFNELGSVIRSFYLNIQNPASWSASNNASRVAKNFGSAGIPSRTSPARKPLAGHKAVRRIGGKHGAGINPYTDSSSKTMSIKDLMSMVNVDEKVPIDKFLAMFSGGFGSWDFSANHRSYIKNRAYTWDTAPATIQSIGQVGHGYKVDRWKNGRASFTWDDFLATAQDVFSAIPYKFYYDSEWKGNWVNALLSGATNCSDGSDALIALARVFGFDGYKQHTTLKNGVGHFFAVINGRKMDTTNFQNHGSWSPLGGAGIPTRTASHRGNAGETQGKTVNITVSMDNATIYGVEDLDNRIQESVQKGLQQEFNDPYTVAI